MDTLILHYHKKEFQGSGLILQSKTDVKNSDTSIGVMFSSMSMKNWAMFLTQFFIENKDAESRLLKEAILAMKIKVSLS